MPPKYDTVQVTDKHYFACLTTRSEGKRELQDRDMAILRYHVVAPVNRAVAGQEVEFFRICQPGPGSLMLN